MPVEIYITATFRGLGLARQSSPVRCGGRTRCVTLTADGRVCGSNRAYGTGVRGEIQSSRSYP